MVAERPLLKLTSVLGRMSEVCGSLPIYQTRENEKEEEEEI